MRTLPLLAISLATLATFAACGGDDGGTSDKEFQDQVVAGMHDSISADLADLQQAAMDLQAAAPTPSGRGWDATLDAQALVDMKAAWKRCRVAYEHVEGATAPIFGQLDITMDARYDDFLATLGAAGDPDPFDGSGITGMHGIERILYSDQIPQAVTDFEETLDGYAPARFPETEQEAMAFKTGIAQKLIDDAGELHDQWVPANIDIGLAFQGLIGLMNEQKEKVDKASTGEEESRYAQTTLFDLRNNLDGTKKIYALFRPWVQAKSAGMDVADADDNIENGFTLLDGLYNADAGDNIPAVPADWSSDNPTPADLQTPFGMLWQQVHEAVDPQIDGTVVFEMNEVAVLLGFPEFAE